ncbi:hypothetical protein [Porphyromonas macacae]|nr:hypothetical protein [Porphyromonas macacae]
MNAFSKQERALFVEEHKGEQCNGFRSRRWRGYALSFAFHRPVQGLFSP